MAYRILQLISSAGFFGAESVLVELSACLRALGQEPVIGVFDHSNPAGMQVADVAARRGLAVKVFKCGGAIDWRAIRAIDAYTQAQGIAVVHSHGYKSNTYALLSGRGRRFRRVSTCHNWINADTKMRVYGMLDRFVLRRFDAVVPVSGGVRAALVEAGFAVDSLSVIENGIDTDRYGLTLDGASVRSEFGFAPAEFVVGVIARLSEEKGHRVLLEAMRSLDAAVLPWRLLLVGDGPLRAELERAASDSGIADRIVFAGQRNDVPRLLSGLDVSALPSTVEAQPMALLEAMAAGVPVVASAVGDVPSILVDGKLGLLVKPRDAPQLAAALLSCHREAPAARARADAARADVVARRSSLSMARAYLALYDRLVAGGANV